MITLTALIVHMIFMLIITPGKQCVDEVLPIIEACKGPNHPLVGMLKEIQAHFHQRKRVRFFLEPSQRDRQQHLIKNPDVDRLLVLKINDRMELEQLKSHMKNTKSPEGKVKSCIKMSCHATNVFCKLQKDIMV